MDQLNDWSEKANWPYPTGAGAPESQGVTR